MCDLTFSISLQMQAECARASSGTVNKMMYSCGVWAACGDPWGHPTLPKGDQLSPSLWQSLFVPHTPRFCKASESQALGCVLDGDKEVSLLRVWARVTNAPRPGRCHAQCPAPGPAQTSCSRQLETELKHCRSQCPQMGTPLRELWAPARSTPQALPTLPTRPR